MAHRIPNYKLGWLIEGQLAALTHFHKDVTADDFQGVMRDGESLLRGVESEFSILIDNRRMVMEKPVGLHQMKQMVSYMKHPLLRWVVVVKPEVMVLDEGSRTVEKVEETRLWNALSLEEAVEFLNEQHPAFMWSGYDHTFFP